MPGLITIRVRTGTWPEATRKSGAGEFNTPRMIELAVELGARYFQVCAAQPPIPQIPFPDQSIKTLRSNFLEALKRSAGMRKSAISKSFLNP